MVLKLEVLGQLLILICLIQNSLAIDCYRCSSTDNKSPFQCNEFLSDDADLSPISCDDVYGARYCVKHTGRYEALSIDCYQCSSSEILNCADGMIHLGGIQPKNCSHVFEAEYCVKSTGLGGGIGTKRFCSSFDLGNYCNYVRQPGDILNYRTCIYTCKGDGCNPANKISSQNWILMLNFVMFVFLLFRFR